MKRLKKQKLSRHGEKMLRELGRQLIDISAKYIQFKTLFLSGDENRAVLERTAQHFFDYVGESLFRDIMLSIARMCDPAKTGKNDNLTFERLADELPEPYRKRYLRKVAALSKKVRRVTTWRHKHLAHNDLLHSLKQKKLPVITYDYLSACVKDAVAILNVIECDYKGEVFMHYDQVFVQTGADKLINHLTMWFEHLDKLLAATQPKAEKGGGHCEREKPELILRQAQDD
jgi:hypothetical protein